MNLIQKITLCVKRPYQIAAIVLIKAKCVYYLRVRTYFEKQIKFELSKDISVRQPTYFLGSGTIKIGKGVLFGIPSGGYYRKHVTELVVRQGAILEVGAGCKFNNNLFISSWLSIRIGEDCLFGHNCEISDADGHEIHPLRRKSYPGQLGEVVIGNNVWLGHNCKILMGSEIGDNSIVAAGAVVKGIFPDNVIIGGVPARIIKHLDV